MKRLVRQQMTGWFQHIPNTSNGAHWKTCWTADFCDSFPWDLRNFQLQLYQNPAFSRKKRQASVGMKPSFFFLSALFGRASVATQSRMLTCIHYNMDFSVLFNRLNCSGSPKKLQCKYTNLHQTRRICFAAFSVHFVATFITATWKLSDLPSWSGKYWSTEQVFSIAAAKVRTLELRTKTQGWWN